MDSHNLKTTNWALKALLAIGALVTAFLVSSAALPSSATAAVTVASSSPSNGAMIEASCYTQCTEWGKYVPLSFVVNDFDSGSDWAYFGRDPEAVGAQVAKSAAELSSSANHSAFCNGAIDTGVRDLRCEVNPLKHGMSLPNTTYFWRPYVVLPADQGGTRVLGEIRSFTIGPGPTPPAPEPDPGPSTAMTVAEARTYFSSMMIKRKVLTRKWGCWRIADSGFQCSAVYRKKRRYFNFKAQVFHIIQNGEVYWIARRVQNVRF